VLKSRKSGQKFDVFAPQIWERGPPTFLGDICKSTPHPTYWPCLVEIPWLVFIYADEMNISAEKYNGLAFGGHNKTLINTAHLCRENTQ